MLGFKVPEGHFYTLSGTGKSSQLLPRPLSVQDINCMLGSVIISSVWQRVESERKRSSYVLLSIHSPAHSGPCRAECGHPAQLAHPNPAKAKSRTRSQEKGTPGTKVAEVSHGSEWNWQLPAKPGRLRANHQVSCLGLGVFYHFSGLSSAGLWNRTIRNSEPEGSCEEQSC